MRREPSALLAPSASRPRLPRAADTLSFWIDGRTSSVASSPVIELSEEHVNRRFPLCLAVAAFAALLACGKSSSASAASATNGADSALLKRADHGRIEGSASAPVWVIEVSDFQCPYC